MSTTWTPICPLTEILPNTGCCALFQNRQVAIFRIHESNQVYAIQNYDPFSGANVLARGIVGDLQGQLVVASPLYKQHFSLTSGQCLEDETVQVEIFPVRVLDGKVELGARAS